MTALVREVDPLKPLTSDFYHVDPDVVEFTEKHLEIHNEIFNPVTRPEYFVGFSHMGLDYVETVLMEASDLQAVKSNGHQQKYRHGNNSKYKSIKDSIIREGVDLREKHCSIVIDNDGDITDVFSGNTLHDAITAGTKIQNRIVNVFRKNKNFSI